MSRIQSVHQTRLVSAECWTSVLQESEFGSPNLVQVLPDDVTRFGSWSVFRRRWIYVASPNTNPTEIAFWDSRNRRRGNQKIYDFVLGLIHFRQNSSFRFPTRIYILNFSFNFLKGSPLSEKKVKVACSLYFHRMAKENKNCRKPFPTTAVSQLSIVEVQKDIMYLKILSFFLKILLPSYLRQ